jgi:hypothetical protein
MRPVHVVGGAVAEPGRRVAAPSWAVVVGIGIVLEIAFVVVACLAALNLQVKDCLACAWCLEDWPAPHSIALCAVEQR